MYIQNATSSDMEGATNGLASKVASKSSKKTSPPKAAAGAWNRIIAFQPDNFDARIARAQLDVSWRADTRPLHALIAARLKESPAAAKQLAQSRLDLALSERDVVGIEQAMAELGDNVQFSRAFWEGVIARMKGDAAAAHSAFSAARTDETRASN